MATTAVPETFVPPFRRRLAAWLPTLVWVVMIGLFSTDTFSANHTGSVLLRVLRIFHINISAHQFWLLHIFIRKLAHFTVYGILSGLAFVSWRVTILRQARWTLMWTTLALLLTLTVASLDEFHQIFVPSRGPSFGDVMLDMTGAVFVQIVIATFTRSDRKGPRA